MPAIVFLNRKWMVGSDDFVYNMAIENLIRFIWFLVLLVIFMKDFSSIFYSECDYATQILLYYTGMEVLQVFMFGYNYMIMKHSMRGDIMDYSDQRILVPFLLKGKLILLVLEAAWICFGTFFLDYKIFIKCSFSVVIGLKIVISCGWIIFIFFLIFLVLTFDPMGNATKPIGFTTASSTWKRRCKMMSCTLPCKQPTNLDKIAEIIAAFFYNSDLVVSDIMAGLVLLHDEQITRTSFHQNLLIPYTYGFNIVSNIESKSSFSHVAHETGSNIERSILEQLVAPQNWMTLVNAEYFLKFAAASYGSCPHIMLGFCYNLVCPCCMVEDCWRSSEPVKVHCCMTCHIANKINVNKRDFLFADFKNKPYESPFYIVADHASQSIVLSIRGTLSFSDTITDMSVEAEDMGLGGGTTMMAHGGMLKTARNIFNTLMRQRPIQDAREQYPDYRLVITGHSLGAGVASLLAVLLKDTFPSLVCYAFSTPGWVISFPLVEWTEEFIMTVVVGKDVVPRMGLNSLRSLKHHITYMVQTCPHPKYQVFNKGLLRGKFFKRFKGTQLHTMTEEQRSEMLAVVARQDMQESDNGEYPDSPLVAPLPLTLPGKILYLDYKKQTTKFRSYTAYWAHRDFFKEILVSTDMFYEHVPETNALALRSAILSTDVVINV